MMAKLKSKGSEARKVTVKKQREREAKLKVWPDMMLHQGEGGGRQIAH